MKRFNDLFREYIGYVLSLLVVLAYILTAVFTLDNTGQTIQEILVNSFIIFILGILLSNTMGHQGMNDGELHDSVIQTKQEHMELLTQTQPYWHETPEFCELKNTQALRQERERILNFATLKYSDFFDNDGRFIGALIQLTDKRLKPLVDRKNNAILKAIKLEITQISPTDLITENAKPNDPLARGRSKAQYLTESNIKDLLLKVLTAVFGGLYTASFIGADLGEIAYRIVIAIILLAFGVVKYYANYRYMVGENKDRTIMATHWLKEFKTLHENGTFKVPDSHEN